MSTQTPRRRRQPEPFDVGDFLRETDSDLKSALSSLLRSTPEPTKITEPGPSVDPGPILGPPPIPLPGPILDPELQLEPPAALDLSAAPILRAAPISPPGPILDPASELAPPITLYPAPRTRSYPIREMKVPEDAHTRAEQFVYDYLWSHAETLDDVSRKITIGLGALAKAVRLSESNARINARSLASKLALEEHDTYNCEQSIGRTYRIFAADEILRRRREAGLRWYMRRTLAVIFVDPAGQPIQLKSRS